MQPDFGPSLFRSRYGASCVGARNFLIAYSVNIQGSEEQAQEIVHQIKHRNVAGESVNIIFLKISLVIIYIFKIKLNLAVSMQAIG